jgi:hypothetical protein
MRDADILSPEVRALVRRHVPAPLHLEVLVALARDPERRWNARDVGGQKYPDADAVARALEDLRGDGLARREGPQDAPVYALADVDAATRRTLALLVSSYDRVPVQLVRAVYERPPEAVQSFADAFRLQKDR